MSYTSFGIGFGGKEYQSVDGIISKYSLLLLVGMFNIALDLWAGTVIIQPLNFGESLYGYFG